MSRLVHYLEFLLSALGCVNTICHASVYLCIERHSKTECGLPYSGPRSYTKRPISAQVKIKRSPLTEKKKQSNKQQQTTQKQCIIGQVQERKIYIENNDDR